MNRIPGVAWIALITGLISWLQMYFGNWEYTAGIVIVLGMVVNFIKVYFTEPEVPVSQVMGTARGVDGGSSDAPGKLSRFFF